MSYPEHRPRRLRRTDALRRLVSEHALSVNDFVRPLFVRPGKGERRPVASMPGVFQTSVDELLRDVEDTARAGIPGVILFGIPERKDAEGTEAWAEDGIVQQALRAARQAVPDMCLMADTCFCEYTDHGHCGPLAGGEVDNDATLENLARTAAAQAAAGADIIAPSGMMDGMVAAIRSGLDHAGHAHIPVLSYAAKYCSAFYGPFREAAESTPLSGDRRGYQMDPANSDEAMREVKADIAEGADIIMVKPALPYLDIIQRVKSTFGVPTAAYCVSGEYVMVEAAAERGWLDRRRTALETLLSIKRAGADFILTYWALDAAEWLAENNG